MKRLNLLFKFGVLCMVIMSIMACGANDNVEEFQEQYVSDSVSEQKGGNDAVQIMISEQNTDEVESSVEDVTKQVEDEVSKFADLTEFQQEISRYLSTLLESGLTEYSEYNIDYSQLLWIAYRYVYEKEYEKIGYEDEYCTISVCDINSILENYFDVSVPDKSFGDIICQDNKFYFPVKDFGEIGMKVAIIDSIDVDNNDYVVTFYNVYVYPENMENGTENPITNWDEYYGYDAEKMNNDEFCEIVNHYNAKIKTKGEKLILLKFQQDGGIFQATLSEDEAYEKVKKYWESLGEIMPQNVESEVIESGYSFWGYNFIDDHAVTYFRINVDIDTGQMYDAIYDQYLN